MNDFFREQWERERRVEAMTLREVVEATWDAWEERVERWRRYLDDADEPPT